MTIILGLIVAALCVFGLIAYAAVMITFWIVMVVFFAFTIVFAIVTRDPYLGFGLAIPATGVALWMFGRWNDKELEKKSATSELK